jgi:hypothetical protein
LVLIELISSLGYFLDQLPYVGKLIVFEVVGLHLGEATHDLDELFDWEDLALF